MEFDQTYKADIRLSDGTLGLEIWGVTVEGYIRTYDHILLDATGTELGAVSYRFDHELAEPKPTLYGTDTMPKWWKPKSQKKIEQLIERFERASLPIPTTNNIVTFQMFRDNGALMGQLRSFVSPQGTNIGNPGMPSMHGGQIDEGDFPAYAEMTPEVHDAAAERAVIREVHEEFGVIIMSSELHFVGKVYDADNSRFNLVYAILIGYETALKRTYNLEGPGVDNMLKAIFNCEGVGRITNMFAADLNRAVEIKALTPISIEILKAIPTLAPNEKPH